MKIEGIKVIDTLKDWGYDAGEFEEIVARLAEDAENCILAAKATAYPERDLIIYELTLTNRGVDVYTEWCAENEFHPSLVGKGNVLVFDDQDEESVRNTLEEWGM